MTLWSLGLVRGVVGQIVGFAAGMALVIASRLLFGFDPVWNQEPALVGGIIIGSIGFLIGVGALTDWFKWMRGIETPLHHGPPTARSDALLRRRLQPQGHRQYGVTGIILLRHRQCSPSGLPYRAGRQRLPVPQPVQLQHLFEHARLAALAAILLGIGGMANYPVLPMIGAEDMAFPRLNAFAFDQRSRHHYSS